MTIPEAFYFPRTDQPTAYSLGCQQLCIRFGSADVGKQQLGAGRHPLFHVKQRLLGQYDDETVRFGALRLRAQASRRDRVLATSSEKGTGIPELRAEIAATCEILPRTPEPDAG